MKTFPTDAALEAAIVAHVDEDTPRLAYADWLDEHGDPDRAAFIRVQCRLADLPPSDPAWVDLIEQQDELVARLKARFLTRVGAEADRFYFGSDLIGDHEEPFRRGFPYFIDCQTSGAQWTPEETARVTTELTRLARTTTIRGFHPYSIPVDALRQLLAAPVFSELTGSALGAHGNSTRAELVEFFRLVAANPALRGVRHLFLYSPYLPVPAAELVKARTFGAVRRLTVQRISGPKAVLETLTKTSWFRRVEHFRCFLDAPSVAVPMITGLGKLPQLHTLELPQFAPGAVAALAKGKFPELARLLYGGPLAIKYAKLLASGRFPSLSAFESGGGVNNEGLFALLKAKWFAQLRVLSLPDNSVGDKGVKALAAHPVAQTLRILRLGDNPFGKSGLTTLAAPGAFPTLTTLDLHCYHTRKGKPAELAAWLASLRLPNLRHLDLMGWPLGNEGAKALAANPALAGLTRLNLNGCGISDSGAKALFASPHLQNLVELQLSYNSIRTGADALANRAVMPRLGECWLSSNALSTKSAARIERDGLYLIV